MPVPLTTALSGSSAIVTGNFAKNEVVKYFEYEIFGDLNNANHIDQNGLFIGNHHYPMDDAIERLNSL